jgi:hypothetical protein
LWGIPYFDQLRAEKLDARFIEQLQSGAGPLVAILPGVADAEVKSNLGYFLRRRSWCKRRVPNVRFAIASFKQARRR